MNFCFTLHLPHLLGMVSGERVFIIHVRILFFLSFLGRGGSGQRLVWDKSAHSSHATIWDLFSIVDIFVAAEVQVMVELLADV